MVLYIGAKFCENISDSISYEADTKLWSANVWRDGRMDIQSLGQYTIIPHHFFVAGHNNKKKHLVTGDWSQSRVSCEVLGKSVKS